MIKYLLDTDMIVDIIRSPQSVASQNVREVSLASCAITDLTLFELYCGAAASDNTLANKVIVDNLKSQITVLNSSDAYFEAASQKVMLKRSGKLIEDFDLLIGCTAKVHAMTLVTGNLKHMSRIEGLEVCCWR